MSSYAENLKYYEERYKEGYGLVYPDGQVVRVVNHIMKYEMGFKGGNILDYGCGNGQHLRYFEAAFPGSTLHGLDIDANSIAQAKQSMPHIAGNLDVCAPVPDLAAKYPAHSFDFIFSNQVLYFLETKDAAKLIDAFRTILKPGGLIYVSWMDPQCYYHKYSEAQADSEMRVVTLAGRIKNKCTVNFKTRDELAAMFEGKFKKLHLGYYDSMIREDEGSTKHNFFVGQAA